VKVSEKTVALTVNGQEVQTDSGRNLLEVLLEMGIDIPHLCYHPAVAPYGSCRLCVVEIERHGRAQIAAACTYPVEDGLGVLTHSPRVLQVRKQMIGLLYSRCPNVPVIQQMAAVMGIDEPTFPTENPDEDCILCGLCVRVCDEVVGAKVLGFVGRGSTRFVSPPFEQPSDQCVRCGACALVCPTGAIQIEVKERTLSHEQLMRLLGAISRRDTVPDVPYLDPAVCIHFKTNECKLCERVCEAGAIVHDMAPEEMDLDIGAVVIADSQQAVGRLLSGDGVYRIPSDDFLDVAAVTAKAMSDLAVYRERLQVPSSGEAMTPAPSRVGVFVCRCGGQIDGVVDVSKVVDLTRQLPQVICAQDLPFSCSEEYAQVIQQAVTNHRLNRVVLAACSCCSLDQVCYSCTTQRIRCKTNLGVLAADSARLRELYADMYPRFEFVNIREHCAWLHSDDPAAATAEAERLIAAAVANVNLLPPAMRSVIQLSSRVLVAGDGAAGGVCADALMAQGFAVTRSGEVPSMVVGSPGKFTVTWGGNGHQRQIEADAVILAPSDAGQLNGLQDAVGIVDSSISLAARLTGVFVCPPDGQAEVVGAAVAARVAALLGSGQMVVEWNVARVDPQRCRACGTCVSLCEFHAPRLVADNKPSNLRSPTSNLVSRIDPALCCGCGTCAAHCPSSAITVGYSTDEQIEAMLAVLLA
jgi:bidirectional [NiFe] hydrogenase diaphorase subunit